MSNQIKKIIIIFSILFCFSSFGYSLENYQVIKSSIDNKEVLYLENNYWITIATVSNIDKAYLIDDLIDEIKVKISSNSEIEPYHIQDVFSDNRHILINPLFIDKIEKDNDYIYIYWTNSPYIFTVKKTAEIEYILRRYTIGSS